MKQNKYLIELTPELRSLVKTLVMAKAWVESVHPIVTGYQKHILKEIGAVDEKGRPITNPLMDFSMNEGFLKSITPDVLKRRLEMGCSMNPNVVLYLKQKVSKERLRGLSVRILFLNFPGVRACLIMI